MSRRRLTVKHKRTLQLEEDVLCVKFSPDHRLLAVSLLDCTVKLFYTDTLKVPIHNRTRPLDPTLSRLRLNQILVSAPVLLVSVWTQAARPLSGHLPCK